MDIRSLRYFIAVAEAQSFSRAAEATNVVQSAISHQVKSLERELAAPLFLREGRAVRLTPAGAVLLDDARRIVAMLSDTKRRIGQMTQGDRGSLQIGFQSAACRRTIVSAAFQRLRERCPAVDLDLVPMTGLAMQAGMETSQIDGGFFYYGSENPALDRRVLHTDNWVLALPRSHPLAKADGLRLKDLENEKFIWFPRRVTPALYDRMLAACSGAGFAPNIVQEAFDESIVLNLVAVGMGLAFVLDSLPDDRNGNIVFKRVADFDIPTDLCFVWSRTNRNPILSTFLSLIAEISDAG